MTEIFKRTFMFTNKLVYVLCTEEVWVVSSFPAKQKTDDLDFRSVIFLRQ